MTSPSAYLTLPWTWDMTYSVEDQCWLITVAEFPDFVAAGDSPQEAAMNSREALVSHIMGYVTKGKELPKALGQRDYSVSVAQSPDLILVPG